MRLRPGLESKKSVDDGPREFPVHGRSRGGGSTTSRFPVPAVDRSSAQRARAFAPFFAVKVTRVLLGDFLPSKNDTRFAPLDFGAVNFTRTRRGIFFPSRKETVSLPFATMGNHGRAMSVKRPLNPNQATYPAPSPADAIHLT